MLESTQNNCVICLENEGTFNPLIHKASYFNCNCSIYFHKDCWTNFLITNNKCPYCRIIRTEPINPLYLLVKKYNIFLLFLQILISPACVLYTIGLAQFNTSDQGFSNVMIISSTTYLDFLMIFIVDCNTGLLLNSNFRKLFIIFNTYKFLMCIISIILMIIGNLNGFILYATLWYIGSYCLFFLVFLVTFIFIN